MKLTMWRVVVLLICTRSKGKVKKTIFPKNSIFTHVMLRDTHSEPWLPVPWLDILRDRSREVRLFTQPSLHMKVQNMDP